ncbi:hypothetical protein Dsin_004988 [Dipteronia sinensis]|uniref:RNase H type-1 domain-containing protein n=1 Tax=Dipteronia sinensis TaxID=43782 RepID=A0AAE0EE96_9ROSI|nr:hypothetical protein Dsin_004988 [Dipteronia sinensis]
MGRDVILTVQDFFHSGVVTPGLNSNFIVLLPQMRDSITIDQFRPIVLVNFLFKVSSKILADMLAQIAARIVSPQQFGFIRDRHVEGCIALAFDCVNVFHKKYYGGNMAMKIDIRKVFDTLIRSSFVKFLGLLVFQTFMDWIVSILGSSKLSVLINGSPTSYFGCSRGVRQGDPLSPLIFGIVEDFLFSPTRISYLQSLVGMQIGRLPFSYLGVPLFRGKPRKSVLMFIALNLPSGKLQKPHGGYITSSIWNSFRINYVELVKDDIWLIEENSQRDFWRDNWLEVPILDLLGILDFLATHLHARVSDFIRDALWEAVFSAFQRRASADTYGYFFRQAMSVSFSDQIKCGALFMSQNRLGIGCMRNCVDDLLILHRFCLSGRPGKAPVIRSVVWSPPVPGWIKVNTDGAALGSPGVSGCGGVFLTYRSFVKACFAVPLGQVFAFEAELHAASLAINYAWNLGWHRIWLESDSSYVVQLLSIRSDQVTWRVRQAWQRCIHQISYMEFQVSHLFREGNQVADALSKHALVFLLIPGGLPLLRFVLHLLFPYENFPTVLWFTC